jgi:transcriptional regulator with XRE-family HTH domain
MEYDEFNAKFGTKLKYYRLLQGFTQEDLSERLDVDAHYISDIERGTRNITLKTLYKIACSLNVDPYKLFYFD